MREIETFIKKNEEDIIVTGGISNEKIAGIEESLQLTICKDMKDFLLKFGMILGYGVEILGCGKTGISSLESQTKRFREFGLPHNYLVIRNVDEWLYCLNNDTGTVSSWDRNNQKFIKCSDSLEKYILDELEEAQVDWE